MNTKNNKNNINNLNNTNNINNLKDITDIKDFFANGNIPVALAPMAGCADRAFREICMEFGASFCVGELCSAKGVSLNDKKSEELLFVSEKERPMGTQLFGSDIDALKIAAQKALKYNPSFLDINMGCPAPKVISSGGGSALLKNPQKAAETVKALKKVLNNKIPLTCKIRIGYDQNSINAVFFAKELEKAGADMITVHGRTKDQMYRPGINFNEIKNVKQALKIPVIANGDITDGATAKYMLDKTGADGIMIGRAALGNPFIFKEVKAYLKGENYIKPKNSQKAEILIYQAEKMLKYKDPHNALLEIRKHAAWYIKGIKNAAFLRQKCFNINSLNDVKEIAFIFSKSE